MNATASYLARVRAQLITLLVSAAVAAAAVYAAIEHFNAMRQAHEAASAATTDAETRASTAIADKATLTLFKPTFEALRASGVIGEEQRIPWVEYFTKLAAQANPADLSLQIQPRRVLANPPATPDTLEGLQYYASAITIKSKVLHEMDALRLLQKLKAVQGASVIRRCLMKRAPEGAIKIPTYLLEFDCDGDVITLDKAPNAAEGAS